jgi:hypothetical protein
MPRDGVLRVQCLTGPPDILGRRPSQVAPPRAWKVTRAPDRVAEVGPGARKASIHIFSTTEEAPPRPRLKLQEMLVLQKSALSGERDSLTPEDLKRLLRCTELVKRLRNFAKNSYLENLVRFQQRQEQSRQKSRDVAAAPQSVQRRFRIRCRFVAFAARYVTFQESTSARADAQRGEREMQGGAEDKCKEQDEREERDRLEAVREAAEKKPEEGRREEQRREAEERRRQEFEMAASEAEAEAARERERLFEERAKREYDMQRQAQERRTTESERAEARRQEELRTKEEEAAAREQEEAVRERERQRERQEEEVRRREIQFLEMMVKQKVRLAARAQERQERVAKQALGGQQDERRREQEAVREQERARERHNTLSFQRSQEEAKRRKHAKEEGKQFEQWEQERMRELEAVRERERQRAEDEPKRQTRTKEECETVPVALVGRELDGCHWPQSESDSRSRLHNSKGGGSGRTISAPSPEHQEARLAARPRHQKGICDVCRFPVTSYQHRTKNWRGAYVHISCLNPEEMRTIVINLNRQLREKERQFAALPSSEHSEGKHEQLSHAILVLKAALRDATSLQQAGTGAGASPTESDRLRPPSDSRRKTQEEQDQEQARLAMEQNTSPQSSPLHASPAKDEGLRGLSFASNFRPSSSIRTMAFRHFYLDGENGGVNEHDVPLHHVTVCGVTASSLHDTWDWLSRRSVPALQPPGPLARASEDVTLCDTLGTRWLF